MKIELSKQEYKNLALEFSYYSDIKPEIYRILKYKYNIENIDISLDEQSEIIFFIQDEVLELYKKLNK